MKLGIVEIRKRPVIATTVALASAMDLFDGQFRVFRDRLVGEDLVCEPDLFQTEERQIADLDFHLDDLYGVLLL